MFSGVTFNPWDNRGRAAHRTATWPRRRGADCRTARTPSRTCIAVLDGDMGDFTNGLRSGRSGNGVPTGERSKDRRHIGAFGGSDLGPRDGGLRTRCDHYADG